MVKLLPRLVSKGLGSVDEAAVVAATMPLLLVLEATAVEVTVVFSEVVFPVEASVDLLLLSVVADPDRFLKSISESCSS